MKKLIPFLLAAVMTAVPLAGQYAGLTDTVTASAADAALSNPAATAETQSLYRFLCDTYGNHVISGQQESTWMGSEDYEFNIIHNASGKYPALRGLDYMGDDFAGCNRRAKAWHDKGGIVTIRKNGSIPKFVNEVRTVSFSARQAVANGQRVLYVTERCVFTLTANGLKLLEVYPGVDVVRDILELLPFAVEI